MGLLNKKMLTLKMMIVYVWGLGMVCNASDKKTQHNPRPWELEWGKEKMYGQLKRAVSEMIKPDYNPLKLKQGLWTGIMAACANVRVALAQLAEKEIVVEDKIIRKTHLKLMRAKAICDVQMKCWKHYDTKLEAWARASAEVTETITKLQKHINKPEKGQ